MAYTKPQVIAQNASSGSYAAGCPTNQNQNGGGRHSRGVYDCAYCEVTK